MIGRSTKRFATGLLGLGLFVGAVAGCGDNDGVSGAPAGSQAVSIAFKGMVGPQEFSCSQTYTGIGAPASTITPLDFRLYVSDVRLVTSSGEEVPVSLDQDGLWQYADVAMIDFENAAGTCANGTADTNTAVRGIVPAGKYRGLRFVLGVPFALNHQNAATAPSPLNVTAMFWNWNGGYKFLRADNKTNGLPRFNVHLGSTGCEENDQGTVVSCAAPNRAEVSFDQFDITKDAVYADLAELLQSVNVDVNQVDTPPGCMSNFDDNDCTGVFNNLGITFPGGAPDPSHQAFFRRGVK